MRTLALVCLLVLSSVYCKEIKSTNEAEGASDVGSRKKKLFSLFAVVTFPNDQCTAASDSTMYGTCMSSTECADSSGTSDGNCASGFGVCCTFTYSTCTTTVSKNCSYITSPSYPTSYTTSGTCTFTIAPVQSDICSLRIDWDNFASTDPATTTGLCTAQDYLTITSPTLGTTAGNFPQFCGTLTGMHMYVETGASTTSTTIAFTTYASSTGFTWKGKVTQLECTNPSRNPPDCVQYFQGAYSGIAYSYNYQSGVSGSGHTTASMNYATCVRKERGMCSIEWSGSQSPSTAGTVEPTINDFSLDTPTATNDIDTATCSKAYVQFPNSGIVGGGSGQASSNTICGDVFNNQYGKATTEEAAPASVFQHTTPFMFSTRSLTTLTATNFIGYALKWNQIGCGTVTN
jgi:hypothetical protein